MRVLIFGSALFTVLQCAIVTTQAADFTPPKTWVDTTSKLTRAERDKIAQAALDNAKQFLDKGKTEFPPLSFWQSANVVSALAYKDFIAGTQTNRALVTEVINNNFKRFPKVFDKFGFNDDALWWGTASLYAFRAYKDDQFLKMATDNWNSVNKFVITGQQAASGKHPEKNFALSPTCAGKSTAGGVFWRPKVDDDNVNVITTSLFMTLSAYLAEEEGKKAARAQATAKPPAKPSTKASRSEMNRRASRVERAATATPPKSEQKSAPQTSSSQLQKKYIAAATNAHNFIQAHLMDRTQNIPLDTLRVGAAQKCKISAFIFTYNAGKYVEGLMTLADVTKSADLKETALNVTTSAVKLLHWQRPTGVITEVPKDVTKNNDLDGFKAVYIRALNEVYRRNDNIPALRKLIDQYVTIQANSLQNKSRQGTSYGPNWSGPFQGPFAWGQLAALDVMNAFLQMTI